MNLPPSRRLKLPLDCVTRCAALAALVVSLCGCTVWQNVRRTVIAEPFQFSWKFDRNRSLRVYSGWADQEYARYAGDCATGPSDDFGAGFRDGFVDYVYAGGTGEPPPIPPREFWNVGLRTPEGQARADRWFAGYRQGAAAARQGGYRNQAIVQSSYPRGLAMEGAIEQVYELEGAPELIAPAPAISVEELPAYEEFPSPPTRNNVPGDRKTAPAQAAPPAPSPSAADGKAPGAIESPKPHVQSAAPSPVKLPPAPEMPAIDASDEPPGETNPKDEVEAEEPAAERADAAPHPPNEKAEQQSQEGAPSGSPPIEDAPAGDPFGKGRPFRDDPVAEQGPAPIRREPLPPVIESSSATARGELQVLPTAEVPVRPRVVADLRVMPAAAALSSRPGRPQPPRFTEVVHAGYGAPAEKRESAPAARSPAGNPRFQLSR